MQEVSKYGVQAFDSIQQSAANFFSDILNRTKTLAQAFRDMASSILRSMNDIIAKRFAEQLLGPGTVGGGLINAGLSAIGLGPKLATGTSNWTVPQDMFVQVHQGENVTVVPKSYAASAGGSMAPISMGGITINAPGADDSTVQKLTMLAQQIKTDAYAAVFNDLRRNGPIRRAT